MGQFNQLNERLSWLTEELQLYLCLLLRRLKRGATTAGFIESKTSDNSIMNQFFRALWWYFFFCQKLGNFFDQLLFSLSWTANICDPSTIIKSSYGGNLVDLPCCYASNRKRGIIFVGLFQP